jgi:exopolysaccharide biosynthesis predicted pyruvyltransferase EpsI
LAYGEFDELLLSTTPKHQVFPFLLLNDSQANEKAMFIADGLKLPLFKHSRLSSKLFAGPRSWLTNIKNSDYIITDSFHGLALSIIFRKQFFVFCASESKFTRLRSLLQLLSLEHRYVESIEDFVCRKEEILTPIDYNLVSQKLEVEKKYYTNFIKEYVK